jgi:ubiquinone/menaquinone biosynthesis C-methylase UbiE
MIDRSLNYGRKNLISFFREINHIENALDVGAGDGADLVNLQLIHPRARLHAIEYYPPNITELTKKNVNVLSLNFENSKLPYENESIDLIISNQTIEHTKELFWVFHEMTRVLKVDGSLIIGVPNLASLHNRILLAFGKQPTSIQNHSAHIRGFTKSDLVQFVQIFNDGYALRSFKGSNFYPFPPFIANPLARILPGLSWGLTLHFKKERSYNQDYFLKYPIEKKLETNFFLG